MQCAHAEIALLSIEEKIDDSPPDFINKFVKQPEIKLKEGRVTLQILPKIPAMRNRDLLNLFTSLATWGVRYGFVDCDFAIR